ncbi:pilus assembly protein PilJ [Acinetobacter sp.]|uniref:pilus assembly protein PilJ n=1 Tax=Acinetobacter sp. TaxID=472 RepID=UPI002588660B|nr:pilus assembly protein PilJ [Acinetobacter sp.]
MTRPLMGVSLAVMLSACANMAADTDHGLCDLKLLSLQIPKETQAFIRSAHPSQVEVFKHDQQKLNQALEEVQKKYANRDGVSSMLADGQAINANIDLLVKHQAEIDALYEYSLLVRETIPGIQAEYNLMVDMMARNNASAMQAVIAKNQVFVADRVLRSMDKMFDLDSTPFDTVDDFLSDFNIFNLYLNAQLNGSAELGVERVKDAELRESLLSIQADIADLNQSDSLALLQKREPVVNILKAAQDNMIKSDQIFNTLQKLE